MPSDPGFDGILLEQLAAVLGDVGGGRVHGAPERLHHRAPIGLLVVAGPNLPDLALDVEHLAGEGQRRAPLARTRLGGQLRDPGLGVVVRLGHRGVRLVRARRAPSLVLVVDAGRSAQRLLQATRPVQRSGPPQSIDVEDLTRYVDVAVGRDLLGDEIHREQGGEILWPGGFEGAGVQRRRRRLGQVGHQVVPSGGHLTVVEHVSERFAHRSPSVGPIR